jgi:hypothetical protein
MHILCSFVILLTIAIAPLSAATTAANLVVDELEHLLVDTGGANDGGFKRAITPCTNYVSGSQLLGRETAAQWIRVAFRTGNPFTKRIMLIPFIDDFVTANVTSGTGGIDASIGFETLRTENSGAAMNDSLGFFAPFINQHVSSKHALVLRSLRLYLYLNSGRCDSSQCRHVRWCLWWSSYPLAWRTY